jgi:CO/xanthine dehydrogenase FAD-binding subunit
MILEYHRPRTLETALELIARPRPRTLPMGGGTVLNRPSPESFAVVDLQALNLGSVEASGNFLLVGAALTLANLAEQPGMPQSLLKALELELTKNLRQAATLAGALVSAGGRSGFACAMLALDAELELRAHPATGKPGKEMVSLGDLLPLRSDLLRARLITQVRIPVNVRLVYEMIARTPADLPIVCVAMAQWKSGRTRVAVGGFGAAPVLAMDGPNPDGAEIAAREVCKAAEDEWASAAYRVEMAAVLGRRCIENLRDSASRQ